MVFEEVARQRKELVTFQFISQLGSPQRWGSAQGFDAECPSCRNPHPNCVERWFISDLEVILLLRVCRINFNSIGSHIS